jgi:cytochrome c oxidase cbb3-type subunit 3
VSEPIGLASADAERLMDHEYDGIQEYDNPLPGWWKAIFAGSIVFAACYGFYYHVANWGQRPDAAYASTLAVYNSQKSLREAADAANVSEALLAKDAADPKVVARGKEVFLVRCASCHTENGRGLIGPNLTDEFQIHGSSRMDIYKTVHDGAPGTPMLAWGEQLPAPDVVAAAAFVSTLRGTNVQGKPPQGQKVGKF